MHPIKSFYSMKDIIDLLTIIIKIIRVMYRTPYLSTHCVLAYSINIVITYFSRRKVQYEAFSGKAKNTAVVQFIPSSL